MKKHSRTLHRGISVSRLEAFSDGVIAVIITLIVLEMRAPEGADLAALQPLLPIFLVYVMSFTVIGIYWNNHHHLLRNAKYLTSRLMWTNLILLFWLSLLPFSTQWLGEHYDQPWPTAFYGGVLFMASIAYYVLLRSIKAQHASDSLLRKKVGGDSKGIISSILFASATGVAFIRPWLADILYIVVALIWFIPDRRLADSAAQVQK